jgi:hypothetical protein
MLRKSSIAWKRLMPVVGALTLGLALASCDKCGNSIFHVEAGPLVCKGGEQPR